MFMLQLLEQIYQHMPLGLELDTKGIASLIEVALVYH